MYLSCFVETKMSKRPADDSGPTLHASSSSASMATASSVSSGRGSSTNVCSNTSINSVHNSQPPLKKVHFEPHLIGAVSTLEEMDIKVLEFQNKKLAQRIEQRMRTEAELRHRIEQLEKRQTQDDAVLNVVNRYWNQLNEDIRVLLQRFDAETSDESENRNENEVTTSFLIQLSTWDKEELDDKLANRVQVSKRAVAKLVQVIDRIMQRNEKLTMAIKGKRRKHRRQRRRQHGASGSSGRSSTTHANENSLIDGGTGDKIKSSGSGGGDSSNVTESTDNQDDSSDLQSDEDDEEDNTGASGDGGSSSKSKSRQKRKRSAVEKLDEKLKQVHVEIMGENRNLQNLNTSLLEKFHTMSLKIKECQDAMTGKETENAELKNQIDELQYDLEKIHCRNDKLENHLAEAIEKLKAYHQIHGDPNKYSARGNSNVHNNVSSQHIGELQQDVEDFKELANNRLAELDKLHLTHCQSLMEVERLKMDVSIFYNDIIVGSSLYPDSRYS